MNKSLALVIPAYNEEQVIASVLADLRQGCADFATEIIVVDDGSSDNTAAIAETAGVTVIRHRVNRGYGAALKTGIRAARTDYVMTIDSDGQHTAVEAVRLWQRLGENEMVVGSRAALLHSPLWRMPGKWLLGALANYLVRQRIPDLNSGLRILHRETVLRYLHLCPSGFSFSTTITLVMLHRGYSVEYIPITVQKRTGKSSISLNTGLQTLLLILRLAALIDPLRVFVPASFIIGLTGVLWEIPYALSGRGVSVGSMMAIVTGMLLFVLGLICDQISQLRLGLYE
ncbi:MAG: family 2 glycosyl transferase [Anaerolineaceae bacterium]|nr:MAG: family 2 glycosyl transferase [Anaerolineaceae bacterium]